tara:strand:+ start:2323 stop:2643 length:321 start_codon:yes stop_codon:yes gene_type:complete
MLNEEKIVQPEINFGDTLNESWLGMFGYWTKVILSRMFGGSAIGVSVKGTPAQVNSFASALSKEKKYLESFMKHGLNNPQTYKSKAKLDVATKNFERNTGIKWPFK